MRAALDEGKPVAVDLPIANTNRTVCTTLSHEITKKYVFDKLQQLHVPECFIGQIDRKKMTMNIMKRKRKQADIIDDRREEEEDAEEEFYSYVTAVEDQTTKGLGTVVLDE